MRFTKMHGLGNDYVYVDCFEERLPENLAELAKRISDRHFGVGGDGLVLIEPSETADARMRMFNADGSESEMCGNAVRCVAKYLYDHGKCRSRSLCIETGAGVLALELLALDNGRVQSVRVDMGEPVLVPERIPTTLSGERSPHGPAVIDAELEVDGQTLRVTSVSMGNPHAVCFVDALDDRWVLEVGPKVEVDPRFPNRVNVEFVEVISPSEVRMRVWERGSGETLACGTGASAVCVAGALTERTGRKVVVHLRGGDLDIEWADDNHVYKTGPAVEVFSGSFNAEP